MFMTTKSLSLQSERYGSTGNIGENFQRLLGAPSLDPLQTDSSGSHTEHRGQPHCRRPDRESR